MLSSRLSKVNENLVQPQSSLVNQIHMFQKKFPIKLLKHQKHPRKYQILDINQNRNQLVKNIWKDQLVLTGNDRKLVSTVKYHTFYYTQYHTEPIPYYSCYSNQTTWYSTGGTLYKIESLWKSLVTWFDIHENSKIKH